jgi:hypothetical protein
MAPEPGPQPTTTTDPLQATPTAIESFLTQPMMTTDPLQMTQTDVEVLLARLLPAFLWLTDDGTLLQLVKLIADGYWDLHARLGMLYAAMFIQTCPEVIIPYMAQGIGVTGLEPGGPGFSQRAWVGRIVSFREHKGSLATLGRAAIAATGWPTYVSAGLATVARTASVRYPGQQFTRWVNVGALPPGDPGALVFQPLTRTAGISGQPSPGGGQAAGTAFPPAAGGQLVPGGAELSIWRLQAFPVTRRTPYRVPGRDGAFTFHPLGVDSPLFVEPQVTYDRLTAPDPSEIPVPLTRAALTAALRAGQVPPPLAVWTVSPATGPSSAPQAELLPASRLAAADLTDWTAPPDGGAAAVIDPELGRLLFPALRPEAVMADYAYGFPGELGGGPYGSATNWEQAPATTSSCTVASPRDQDETAGPGPAGPLTLPDPLDPYAPGAAEPTAPDGGPAAWNTLEDALVWARRQDPASMCVITIGDSATYAAPSGTWDITLAENQQLRIISASEAAPVLDGELRISGGDRSQVQVSGVLFAKALSYTGTGQLEIEHTTIMPGSDTALRIRGGIASVSYCITGRVEAEGVYALSIADTIADGRGGPAITCRASASAQGDGQDQDGQETGQDGDPPGALDIQRTTVLGLTEADVIVAEDCLFTGPVIARRPTRGLITYSYHPAGSKTPPPVDGRGSWADGRPETAGPPRFTSTRFGDPAYGQLAPACPPEIAAGARLGREMGAYNWLRQPARAARLLDALDEMLPAGRTATLIYRT